MQVELLDTFLDLVETKSFHRSADRLGVTQSTISARLKALESAVGARLFERSRAGARLTTEGLRFEPHARQLRHGWAEALRGVRGAGSKALALRIGIQHDLAGSHIGDWVTEFRKALPECAFYVELDYSNQMCTDLVSGALDFAVMYTPRPLPDLHFAGIGDVRYAMVSTDTTELGAVRPDRYILGNFAPAFAAAHRAALPHLEDAPVASGQNSAVAGLLGSGGGSAYVVEETANALLQAGLARRVEGAPILSQPVHAAMHLRHRTQRLHMLLLTIVRRRFAARRSR